MEFIGQPAPIAIVDFDVAVARRFAMHVVLIGFVFITATNVRLYRSTEIHRVIGYHCDAVNMSVMLAPGHGRSAD